MVSCTAQKGEQAKKQKGGKDWWWCPNHADYGKWVHHDPIDCEQPKRTSEETPPTAPKKKEEEAKARLKIKTLTALLDADEDDS